MKTQLYAGLHPAQVDAMYSRVRVAEVGQEARNVELLQRGGLEGAETRRLPSILWTHMLIPPK